MAADNEACTIHSLSPGSEFAHQYSEWIRQLWGNLPINSWLQGAVPGDSDRLPYVLGCLRGAQLIAGGAIILDDVTDRPNWNPWLACLVVTPRHRRQGVGKHLSLALIQWTVRMGFSDLFLFCEPKLTSFYNSLQFKTVERRLYEGNNIVTMRRDNAGDDERLDQSD